MACGTMAKDKKYAVVKFLLDCTYSEVPTIWLVKENGHTQCWWPPRTANTPALMAQYVSPNHNTWERYNVDIMKYCSKYLCIPILQLYI